jgi:integrase
MAVLKLPFIQWRPSDEGLLRPRFAPSRREIDMGFSGCDLRHENRGPWFTYEETRAWLYGADGKSGVYGEILQCRRTGKKRGGTEPLIARGRTVEALINDWLRAITADYNNPKIPADEKCTWSSIESYQKDVAALTWQPETREQAKSRRAIEREGSASGQAIETRKKEPFVEKPLAAIGPPELKAHFNYVREVRGHHMALHVVAAFSAAWTWGQTSTVWRLGLNPRHQLSLPRPQGRCVLIQTHELAAMVTAADAMERWSVGDAILLGLFTGQRQNDRLAIGDDGMIDGRRRFRQNKTRMVVEIKETPRLAQRMVEAHRRVTELMLRTGVRERPTTIVVDESTCAPYETGAYRHRFTDVRTVAIHGWLEDETIGEAIARGERATARKTMSPGINLPWRLAPCPSLALNEKGEWDPKRDQDLRDTCVTLLYRAGCHLQQIADITGHTYASVKTIVENYLARDRASADAAIDKLVTFMERTGMAI